MTKCEYKFRDGKQCEEEALPNANYCILHTELPKDEENEEYKEISKLKEKKFRKKIKKGDFNFEGVRYEYASFNNMVCVSSMDFNDAMIKKWVSFINTTVKRDLTFKEAKIGRGLRFYKARIFGDLDFSKTDVGDFFCEQAGIRARIVNLFSHAHIHGVVFFNNVTMEGLTYFDGAVFHNDFKYINFEIKGVLSFHKARFAKPESQEIACMMARKVSEKLGDEEKVDYYFYREMDARKYMR